MRRAQEIFPGGFGNPHLEQRILPVNGDLGFPPLSLICPFEVSCGSANEDVVRTLSRGKLLQVERNV